MAVAVPVALAVVYYHTWQHWLSYATGSYNVPGTPHNYGFFSGSGSDISELGILFTLCLLIYHAYRKGNCHTHGCWRIGSLPNGDYKVCRKCHAATTGVEKIDHEFLRAHHREHARRRD